MEIGVRSTTKFFLPFMRLAGPFWIAKEKSKARVLLLGLIGLTLAQILISVTITEWSADLFDALEQRSMTRLFTQVGLIILIFAANIIVTSSHLTLKRRLQLDWRGWLTDHLIAQWMFEGRHYLVNHIDGQHDNPDGRIAEDIRIATEYAIDLLHTLFYCSILLISFSNILWGLSGILTIRLGPLEFNMPGHLVWLAMAYALTASVLGWLIGRPLTKATDQRQTVEANFRFALVKARENSLAIALIQGEHHETPHFHRLFGCIVDAWNQQTAAWSRITMFSSGYSVLSMAFPVLVSAPRYILQQITLGTLMQSAQAFQQLVSALSWPVDNMGKVAEWRASVERVLGLCQSLQKLEYEINRADAKRIRMTRNEGQVMRFHDLEITRLDGQVCVKQFNEAIHSGDRILISGDPLLGNKLYKATAGLWPWGSGCIELPDSELLFFMPPRPYLPTDTLRKAICYPCLSCEFADERMQECFELAGVTELLPMLDKEYDWEKTLLREQQQRLGVVRLLLQQPNWIFMQDALDSLSPEQEAVIIALINRQLPHAALLVISNQPSIRSMMTRQINLEPPISCQS